MPAAAKVVVDPEKAVSQPPPAVTPTETKPRKPVAFWKSFAPNQPIVFEDGSSVIFGQERFVTTDETLIEKLKKSASAYNLLVSESE